MSEKIYIYVYIINIFLLNINVNYSIPISFPLPCVKVRSMRSWLLPRGWPYPEVNYALARMIEE